MWGALSAPAPRPIALHVEAREACVARAALAKDLDAELAPYTFRLTGDSEASLVVSVQEAPGKVALTIRLTRPDHEIFLRKLTARDCDEARLAIRFIVSVALGFVSAEAETAADGGTVSSGDAAGASTGVDKARGVPRDAGTDVSGQGDVPAEGAPRLRPETATRARRKPRSEPRDEVPGDAWLGAGLVVRGGAAPGPLLGGSVNAGWGQRRTGAWSPALGLELSYAAALPSSGALGTASFESGRFGLLGCPSLFALGPLLLRPCAGFHAGFLRAAGSDTFEAASATRPWIDVGVKLVLGIPLSSRLDLELGAEGLYSFNRDTFLFDSEVFFRVEPISAGGSLGLVLHLW
ncbi:MAG: hypothetical protein B6A08_06130 [Sorangiineae bacterium NIC37A_2]|jgi:hypothetical protein|nr:MAG: hypothetical protein B6A08_06130 [Sorangiineae bacterium NIC37A_2]